MRTLKLTLEYDGTGLVGWQRQANGISIQQLLEEALTRIEGAPVPVFGAGRTDAGVHAVGQVASTRLEHPIALDALRRALNATLPPAVRLAQVETAADTFHARYDAISKTYRYIIWTAAFTSPFAARYTWHVPDDLDVARMQAAACLVEGCHNFAAFQAAGSSVASTVRTVTRSGFVTTRQTPASFIGDHLDVARCLVYEIAGNGFLRHMVRSLVGTLVEVGRGRRAPESLAHALTSGDRQQAGPTAPPHGLWLLRVDY